MLDSFALGLRLRSLVECLRRRSSSIGLFGARTMPDWMEPPTMSDSPFQVPQSGWLQLYQSVTPPPLGGLRFQNDHASHAEGSALGGSVPNSDAIGANPEYAQSFETLEPGYHEANGDALVDPKPRKGARKRDRDKNWTDEETSVLVKCKHLAFHDKASPFRKHKSSATDWEAISKELRNNPDTSASEKTGDQCRLRWDTLVKSHRIIKERCMQTEQEYAELTEEEIRDLKLATTLKNEWYEAIDGISRKSRSQKRDQPPRGDGDFTSHEGGTRNGANPVSPWITPTHQVPLLSASAGLSPPCSPPLHLSSGRPEACNSSPKQIAIPGFSRLPRQLRSTLLDLILGRRFQNWYDLRDIGDLTVLCRWLSIVQNRTLPEIYDDVIVLVKMELVRLCGGFVSGEIDASYFRVFDKFVKKVIRNNPSCDTHRYFKPLDDTIFLSAREFSVAERIRVLQLHRCGALEKIDFRGLRRLRSLWIRECPVLKELTGWKYLRELGWLEIDGCPCFRDYPDLQSLPSLKELQFRVSGVLVCPPCSLLGISECVRLRRLEIIGDGVLEESGDLSSLKCLEELSFEYCLALATITGLSGLHSLTSLSLIGCVALSRLQDLSHMKELVEIDVSDTGLEEIPGVEKLVSLKTLDCRNSELKHLPDLHHLPALRKVWLEETPLIEDDPSSFYFDKDEVLFNCEETRHVDVSDISDTEHNLSDSSDEN